MGAPDYDRYLQHMTKNHPGCALLTKDEFIRERLESRYRSGGTRCC
jgi:uncharacterized short protein YbdD (DUF466 family)